MYKVLIADDEPLVLSELKNMINWKVNNMEIIATAKNGELAVKSYFELLPDIIITDIKMPVKDGLQVIQEIMAGNDLHPQFIILTSYEDFSFAKKSLQLGAVDYLLKLELTSSDLLNALNRAKNNLDRFSKKEPENTSYKAFLDTYREKFFLRLYNNLFESNTQFLSQQKYLNLNLSYPNYLTLYCEMIPNIELTEDKTLILLSSTLDLLKNNLINFYHCYLTTLDLKHFVILLCADHLDPAQIKLVLTNSFHIVHNLFSVTIICGVGTTVNNANSIFKSYADAKKAFSAKAHSNIHVYSETHPVSLSNDSIDFSLFKKDITAAFDELNVDSLYQMMTKLSQLIAKLGSDLLNAIDMTSKILNITITFFPDGEHNVQQIFSQDTDGYRCLYRQHTVEGCSNYLLTLRDGLCTILRNRKQNYRLRTISNIKDYIRKNICNKLTLNEVANIFNFNPNYLSQVFAQYNDCSFNEYVTQEKIKMAKELLLQKDKKIYEIADLLGFENAFYFSTVFKKMTNMSPSEYIKKNSP